MKEYLEIRNIPNTLVNVIKAILDTIPFTGGFASLIDDYIPSQRELRLQEFTENIANDLSTQTEKEYYLNLVNNLSSLHIQVLTFMAPPNEYLQFNGLEDSIVSGRFSAFFPKVIPNVNLEIIKLAFKDLYNYGFLNTDSSIFNTMTSSSGWSLLGDRVTKNGRDFIKFISMEK